MPQTYVQSVLIHTDPPTGQVQHFLSPSRRAEAMVISKAKAAPEDAPTTVSTSTTTPPIVLEAVDAPASMCEHMMVGESAGTARKANPDSLLRARVQWVGG